jgi:hypothetical protein
MPRGSWMSSRLCSKALQAQVQGSFCFLNGNCSAGQNRGNVATSSGAFQEAIENANPIHLPT